MCVMKMWPEPALNIVRSGYNFTHVSITTNLTILQTYGRISKISAKWYSLVRTGITQTAPEPINVKIFHRMQANNKYVN